MGRRQSETDAQHGYEGNGLTAYHAKRCYAGY